jgi:hypothetical protein
MLNVEMPPDSSPKKTLMANRERLREERDKKAREAQHGSPPPRHSSRWGTRSTSSSPSQKDSPPAAKKTKKAATKKPTKVPETQANGKEAETNDEETQVAGGEEPPDYKDRVVSYTNSDNRPSIGQVGEFIPEKHGYEITFTYSEKTIETHVP